MESSVIEPALASRRPTVPSRQRRLTGWGRTSPASSLALRPRSVEEVADALLSDRARRGGVIARGAGRSYGDAAQNGGGAVIETDELREVDLLGAGPETVVRAGAGATLAQLLKALAPVGLTLPVVPGTRHITVGGAIAADIHGKNHRRDGSFGHHVLELTLCTPDGQLRALSRQREADLFHATLGGMGLTGVIVQATLRPTPLCGPLLSADIDRTSDLPGALTVMEQDDGYRYSIAWLDLLAGGRRFGRSVVMRSNDLEPMEDAGGRSRLARGPAGTVALPDTVRLPGRSRLRVPERLPDGTLRPVIVHTFNTLRWNRAPRIARGVTVAAGEHFFPLDALGQWNRVYGSGGLLQYQVSAPEGSQLALVEVVQRLREARLPMYLAVVKRFGTGSGGLISFPSPGWTLAVDLPADARGLHERLDEIDEWIADLGGRVYLAKDARLRAQALRRMYPRLADLQEVRRRVDPEGLLRSDLASRLGLAGAAPRQGGEGRGL